MSSPAILEEKLKRPVAIFGAGASGKAVAKFLSGIGVAFVIYDAAQADGAVAEFSNASAKEHDLVVFSPGFSQDHEWLKIAREAGALCLTEIDFAAIFWQIGAPLVRHEGENEEEFISRIRSRLALVAVTGTNGKTTLTEFLAFAHKRAGRVAVAVGNNGIPMASMLPADAPSANILICEVSSFQAEVLKYFSPGGVLWTNFDEDHLERHGSMENYFRAKFHLIEEQQSLPLVLGNSPEQNEDLKRILEHRICVVGESVADAAKNFGINLPDYVQVATRAEVKDSVPKGSIFETFPQMENYALAKRYWLSRGLPLKELEDAATVFSSRAHRLAKVVSVGDAPLVEFWNDSKGTNFGAVIAALETFPGEKVFWIGGGRGKGGSIKNFVEKISPRIEKAFLIGETAKELHEHFSSCGVPAKIFKQFSGAIREAYKAAKQSSKSRAIVLFSPGFASFDMFKSYANRGEQFVQIVEGLLR